MPPPGNPTISGMNMGGRIGGNILSGMYRATVRVPRDKLDGTVGVDRGKARNYPGVQDLSGTLVCYFDLSEAVFTPFTDDDWIQDLRLYDDLTGDPWFQADWLSVMNAEKTGEVRGRLEYTIEFAGFGSWTFSDI